MDISSALHVCYVLLSLTLFRPFFVVCHLNPLICLLKPPLSLLPMTSVHLSVSYHAHLPLTPVYLVCLCFSLRRPCCLSTFSTYLNFYLTSLGCCLCSLLTYLPFLSTHSFFVGCLPYPSSLSLPLGKFNIINVE